MKIIVFGASGRVGACVVQQAVARGHSVTAFMRNPGRAAMATGATIVQGDATDLACVTQALQGGYDAVIACVGAPALRPSRIVTDAMAAIVAAMHATGTARLLAVSGTAEMPDKTWGGRLYTGLLRRTPVGHAVRDHDRAYAIVAASGLSWVLAGCNYIANGPEKGRYTVAKTFPGGFKMIRPGDVARFLLDEAGNPQHHQQILGIWYGPHHAWRNPVSDGRNSG